MGGGHLRFFGLFLILLFAGFDGSAQKTGALGPGLPPAAEESEPPERPPERVAEPGPRAPVRELGFLKTSGRNIVDETGASVLLRGVNLGGWLVPEGYLLKLEGPYDRPTRIAKLVTELAGEEYSKKFWVAYRANYTTEADIRAIAEAGFDHIRVPFHYKLFEEGGEGFALLDRLIEWCRTHGLWVVLDMHCAPGGQTGANIDDSPKDLPELWTDPANQRIAIDLWKTFAERYKDEPVLLGYDLLNEPIKPEFSKHIPELFPFYEKAAKAIREVDGKHILFLEGANWANNFSSFGKPFDSNIVYSFHKYWNENNIGSIRTYLDLSKKHNVPLWCGEFGENSASWYGQCTRLLEENGIGWCFWPWKKIQSDSGCVSIRMPGNYKKIIAYTKGGARPDEAESREIFDGLLENMKFANCQVNDEVISALLGTIPGTIEAEDIGYLGEGVSYHDKDSKNQGNSYRVGDGVDIQPVGHNVGWMEDGEWIAYRIFSPKTRVYRVWYRVASLSGGGKFRLDLDGNDATGPVDVSSTGGWNRWQTLGPVRVTVPAGRHELRFHVITGGFNLDWLRFD